ncbi:hypothetical protein PMKS-001971 [Pichia membranifaciens]|uniref:Uncharacterized protein n=1 Tax=Pichia membranifaciens TaxID=4926 RepID=A0A1Q2YG02_9ASCO|nr:hypothetical protein PMKS-001971 [Pichia membranifaciens]
MTEYTRSAGSMGDDDNHAGDYAENYAEDDAVGMHVEMVGGFKAAGVKRARRGSDDVVATSYNLAAAAAAAAAKHKRLYSPGI